jgi:hypothetical protein
VDFDAVSTLCGHCHSQRDQLFRFGRDGAVGHRGLVEGHEALPGSGGQLAELLHLLEIGHVIHRVNTSRPQAAQ